MNGFFRNSSTTILIYVTAKKHKSIALSIFAVHVLTGCNSIPKLYGIRKAKAINTLKSVSLNVFGNLESLEAEYVNDAKRFIASCHGVNNKN